MCGSAEVVKYISCMWLRKTFASRSYQIWCHYKLQSKLE